MSPKVLVVEDDAGLRRLLDRGLSEEGLTVVATGSGHEALAAVDGASPHLIVLDIGLPDVDGRDLCQALRSRGIDAPVLFLTAQDSAPDRISGFGAGADDYLTKPFAFGELTARVKALLRRAPTAQDDRVGDLYLDPLNLSVHAGAASAALTPTEFRLLGILITRAGETVRRRDLVAGAWPPGAIVHDNTLDVYLGRLRKKIESVASDATIHTAHGVGYRLE